MQNEEIRQFRGDRYFLSNFYPVQVEFDGAVYQSSEAAFQAQKTTDPTLRAQFVGISANEAKKLGRQVELRPDWNEVKVGLMEQIVRAKFPQNEDLAMLLLATGDSTLVEGNAWNDVFWGVSLSTGRGENHLGRILMKIREELRG